MTEALRAVPAREPSRRTVITALGIVQILGWGSTFYLPAVLAAPIVADTGWSLGWVVGGISVGLLVAGLISPRVGRAVDRLGGRPVLALSSVLMAAGLIGLAAAPTLPAYLAAWLVIGAGMGTGLYDAVFAALGRHYGKDARSAITNLTLFGGFASTVCWPLSAYLVEAFGWRSAALAYAGLHLVLALPIHLLVFPKTAPRASAPERPPAGAEAAAAAVDRRSALMTALLALVMTLAATIGSIVIVHLLTFLQARGLAVAAAVSLGTLFGPAQVGARVVERLFGAAYDPIWTMVASAVLMAAGLVLLLGEFPILLVVIVFYGAGYGIFWIARGTLPLAIFGPARYAVLMGRLALPSLVAQALGPFAGALLIEHAGVEAAIAVLTGAALLNVVLVALLWVLYRADAAARA